MSSDSANQIDLEAIIRERMGRRSRYIPGFVIRWLKDFVHQDFINEFLRRGYEGVDFCTHGVEYLRADLTLEGLENLPPSDDGRRYTFVSNHPLGGIDGVALGGIIGQRYGGHVKYLVNDLLMNLRGLSTICIPINKIGAQARNFPAVVEGAFRGPDHIIMFPAGLCSRLIDGQIRDLPWKKTFISKSIETQRDIVPIHFIGQNSPRFYRIAQWCKRLGLKFNLAMLFLPDEMYRSCGKHFTVRFGRPIPYTTFDRSRSHVQWAQWVQDEVYKL